MRVSDEERQLQDMCSLVRSETVDKKCFSLLSLVSSGSGAVYLVLCSAVYLV